MGLRIKIHILRIKDNTRPTKREKLISWDIYEPEYKITLAEIIETVEIKNNEIQSNTSRKGIFKELIISACHSTTNSVLFNLIKPLKAVTQKTINSKKDRIDVIIKLNFIIIVGKFFI